LLQMWEDVLRRRPVGLDDDFFELGGLSLLGTQLLVRIEEAFGVQLTVVNLLNAPTVRKMAELLKSSGSTIAHSRMIPLSSSAEAPPLFLPAPHPLLRPFILRVPEQPPVVGFMQPTSTRLAPPFRMADIAEQYVRMLREYQPHGPYSIAGWCMDGVLALEMAEQLRAAGEEVPMVVFIDTPNPARWKYES